MRRACLEQGIEARRGHHDSIAEEVAGEVAFYLCTILKGERMADDDGGAYVEDGADGQARTEEKERDASGGIPLANAREDGEWRVVDDDAGYSAFW